MIDLAERFEDRRARHRDGAIARLVVPEVTGEKMSLVVIEGHVVELVVRRKNVLETDFDPSTEALIARAFGDDLA